LISFPDSEPPEISINISSVELEDQDNADRIIARLDDQKVVYIEYRYYPANSSRDSELARPVDDVRKLAQVLRHANTGSMHILHCIGTVYQEDLSRSLLVYDIPSMPSPDTDWTLAMAIAAENAAKPPLELRVQCAVEIAIAVMFTHAAGLVHKSISPDNILSQSFHLRLISLI
jgi:serine/threonine protein kinase